MSNCHYEVSALLRELFQQNYYRCASYFAYTYRAIAHLFTCSEQFNSFIMDTLFERDGVEFLRWTDANGLFCPMSHDIYEYIESLYED